MGKKDLEERVRKISPARLVTDKLPPVLIIHGDADPLVPLQQSQVFVDKLKAAGGEAQLIVKLRRRTSLAHNYRSRGRDG